MRGDEQREHEVVKLHEKVATLTATVAALKLVLIDLIDASQDARCADLRVVVKRAQAALSATTAGDDLLAQLAEARKDTLSHGDWCFLSRRFNATADLQVEQDRRINEWLKGQITKALRAAISQTESKKETL